MGDSFPGHVWRRGAADVITFHPGSRDRAACRRLLARLTETAPRALDGRRVHHQTQVMAGPFCAMLLADMGADVIKIEPPGGAATRAMDLELAPGVSAPFLAVNRNKRGLVLDLKCAEGVTVLKKLAATADVLIENYRPGVAERLGVDYATLSAINPRLIYCSISGFGQTG